MTYFDLHALDARTIVARKTVDALQRANDLIEMRHSSGIASGTDISRAQGQLAGSKAVLEALAAERAKDEHAIAVLIGESSFTFALPAVDALNAPPTILHRWLPRCWTTLPTSLRPSARAIWRGPATAMALPISWK